MAKKEDDTPVVVATDTPFPTMFGNENYVSDHVPHVNQHHTQEEWLMEAIPAAECIAKGDHVSPRLIEMLFLDALDVIGDFVPPAARDAKTKKADRDN
jgi:hypothetical protein